MIYQNIKQQCHKLKYIKTFSQQHPISAMYSTSKSPKRSTPHIELISNVSKFKTSFKPIISKQNKQILQAKLAVQKQSTAATSQRILNHNLYINYQRNPFVNYKEKKHRFSNSLSFISANLLEKPNRGKKFSQVVKEEETVMDQLTLLQTEVKKPDEKKMQRFKKINQIINQTTKLSNKFLGQIQKSRQQQPSHTTSISSQKQRKRYQVIGMQDDQKQKMHQISIQEILMIPQTNFFLTSGQGRPRINIFKVRKDPDEILNAFERLSQKHFSFESVIHKINKIQIPFLRDISRIGRELSQMKNINVRTVIDLMENQELSIKEKEIKFLDLMGFASGRLSWKLLLEIGGDMFKRGGTGQGESDNSSEENQQDDYIYYRARTQQFGASYRNTKQETQQIEQFAHLQLTQKQIQDRHQMSHIKTRIKRLLESKQYILSENIYDKELHDSKSKQMEDCFKEYIEKDSIKFKDIHKVVRQNKKNSSRNEGFKLKNLLEVLKVKNQIDGRLERGTKVNRSTSAWD